MCILRPHPPVVLTEVSRCVWSLLISTVFHGAIMVRRKTCKAAFIGESNNNIVTLTRSSGAKTWSMRLLGTGLAFRVIGVEYEVGR